MDLGAGEETLGEGKLDGLGGDFPFTRKLRCWAPILVSLVSIS